MRFGLDMEKFKISNRARVGSTLSYWCFFLGFCFKVLIDKGVGIFLFVFGMFFFMEFFVLEFVLDFFVCLENLYVIKRN